MFLRSIALVFLAVSTSFAAAQKSNAIVLITPEAVSRVIRPENYNHNLWIRWPVATNPSGSNRLLSPTTGYDWRESTGSNADTLKAMGIQDAQHDWLGSQQIFLADGVISVDALRLEAGAAQPADTRVPAHRLLIGSANSWDEVAAISRQVDGHTLVISYPPPDGANVSAAWLLGKKDVPVPTSTQIPGLVPATEVVRLVTHPDSYTWRPAGDVTAEQWMRVIDASRMGQMITLFIFTLIIAIWSLRSIATESGGRLARLGIAMVPCAFVALFLAGNFAKTTGLAPWNVLPFFAYFALLLGFSPIYLAMRALWPRSHGLFPIALIAATLLLWAEPLYTVFSHVFTPVPLPASPLALGALVASLTATVSLCFAGGIWPRILAAVLMCTAMIVGVLTHQWWAPMEFLLILPVIALISGAGAMRLYYLPVFVIWPFLYHRWNGRFAWDINWLLNNYADRNAINAAEQMRFLLSPLFLATAVTLAIATFCGGDFLRHQIRRALDTNNNSRALFWCALAVACMGVREPYLLPSALIICIGGFLILLFDAAGAV